MEKAIYFIFILCGILSQGISSVFEGNSENLSNLLIRPKRVVGGVSTTLHASPYLLHVLENGTYHCPATLLKADFAISSAECFINQNTQHMRITSRSTLTAANIQHTIVRVIFLDPNFNKRHRTIKNLALIRFAPNINFEASINRPISIFNKNLANEHSPSYVISWGRIHSLGDRKVPYTGSLRALPVQVISFEYCQNVYPNIIQAENICAFGTLAREYCVNEDSGLPLVMNNQLLGIFVHRDCSRLSNPNVFMSLMNRNIKLWIQEHIPTLHLF